LMLGSVSPVLIQYIDARRPGAGSAAGRLFFTNTMGGLAGGWITAFALIPHTHPLDDAHGVPRRRERRRRSPSTASSRRESPAGAGAVAALVVPHLLP